MSIRQRIEDAAGEYDKWPKSMKEAFRLSTVVDRIPPTLQHGVALLGEIDRLESLLTAATERAEKAEAQRDQMRGLLAMLFHYTYTPYGDVPAGTLANPLYPRNHSGNCEPMKDAVRKALKEVGDE